ncbi:MAG: RND transporter [Spirochaetia bacterium]|nr:RND transporter [Spirochaetia bacterium]
MYIYLEKLIKKIQSHPRLTVTLVGLATVALGLFAVMWLQFSSDYTEMIPPTSIEYVEFKEKNDNFNSQHIIMVKSDRLFDKEVLSSIYDAVDKMKLNENVGAVTSIFDFITIEKKGTRLLTRAMTDLIEGTGWTSELAKSFEERVKNDDIVKGLLVSDEYDAFIFSFMLLPDQPALIDEIHTIFSDVENYADIYMTGDQVIAKRIMEYLSKDLITLLSLSFLVILAVYYLSFRAKRASFIPFSLSVIGIIWTFGAMAILGYKLTVVNIITPVLVLTIGSSYSIHVLSEYFQSYHDGEVNYINKAVNKIGKTIILACITDVIGFISLLTARTNAFKEFGISVSIGITFCAILSVTYLPAILTITIAPKDHHMAQFEKGPIAYMSRIISRVVMKRWILFLSLSLIIVLGFFLTKNHIALETNYMSYFPRKEPIIVDSLSITKTFKGTTSHYITIKGPKDEKNFFLEPANLQKVYQYEKAFLEESKDISHMLSYAQYVAFMNKIYSGKSEIPDSNGLINLLNRFMTILSKDSANATTLSLLINENGNEITLITSAWDVLEQDVETVQSAMRINDVAQSLTHLLPKETTIEIWGNGADAIAFSERITEDQYLSTMISFILVFLVSAISFKSFKFGIFSIIPIVVGIMINYIFMFFTRIPFDIITIGFTSVTIGVGIDDAIHFLIRYKNKVIETKHQNVRLRLRETIHETSRPILLTTAAIVLGISMLGFGSYTPIRYFGILVSTSLLNTMLATLFILPPVILVTETIEQKIKLRKIRN